MIRTGMELLAESLFAVVLYLVIYSFFLVEDGISLLGVGVIVVVQGLFFVLRKKTKHLLSFLLGIITVTGGVIGMNLAIHSLLMTSVVTCITAIYSIAMRCIESFRENPAPKILQFGVMGLLYLALDIKGYETTAFLVFWCTFFYLLLFLYVMVDTNMESFLEARGKTTVMDERQIKRLNRKMTMGYVAVAGVGMLILALFSYSGIYEYLYRFLRWLLSHLQGKSTVEEAPIASLSPEETSFLPIGEPQKEWPWMKYVENAMYVLAAVVLIVLIAAFFYGIFKALYQGFYKKQGVIADQLQETVEVRERLQRANGKKRVHNREGNARGKVRKLYRKRMAGFWKDSGKTPEATTPEEQRKLKDATMDSEVVTVYEKARYSEEEVTKEEVTKLKQLLR